MNLVMFSSGAILWIITGVARTVIDFMSRGKSSPKKDSIRSSLQKLTFDIPGMKTNYYNLVNGFSLIMGVSITLAGVLFLLLSKTFSTDIPLIAGIIGVIASGMSAAMSLLILKLPPPSITFSLATLCFVIALWL